MYDAKLVISSPIYPVIFSRKRLFSYDGGDKDKQVVSRIISYLSRQHCYIALVGDNKLSQYLLKLSPEFFDFFDGTIMPVHEINNTEKYGAAFICETNWRAIDSLKKLLPETMGMITLDLLLDYDWQVIPKNAWVKNTAHIYPVDIPDIAFQEGQDMILLDMPARSISQLPVGFGYVHDALKKENIRLQTMDLDIILYHRYHSDRLLDGISNVVTHDGFEMPEDPWQPVHYLEWEKDEFIDYFQSDIDEIVEKIVKAKPKIIGCSIHQVNRMFTKRLVHLLRKRFDFILIVGGMSCLHADAAKIVFPEADYIVVGEADLTIGPLVHSVLNGETPKDIPGVWSRFDSPGRVFTEGPLPYHLDELGHPRFEWTDLDLYRNWNGYRLAPIVGSRGCQWAKCSFCGERFKWRTRSPEKIVDDIEYFSKNGFHTFVFNESDFHGDTQVIENMCDEIIKRNIQVQFTAQLRCNKKAGLSYYKKMKKAGFGCLRFGVDGWSKHSLKLQKKGYSKDVIRHTLKTTKEAGIFTEVNIVVGVPGETEADVKESIEFLIEMKPYIGRVAFINPFMLFRGSDYWNTPDKYGIVFNMDKEELYNTYPVAIPDTLWHSEGPFIDAGVRYDRFKSVVKALHEHGFVVTDWIDFTDNQVNIKAGQIQNKQGNDQKNVENRRSRTYRGYCIVCEAEGFMAYPVNNDDESTVSKDRKTLNVVRSGTLESIQNSIDELVDNMVTQDDVLIFRAGENFIAVNACDVNVDMQYIGFYECPDKSSRPLLLETYMGYNFVVYDGSIFIAPVSLGNTNFATREGREKKGVRIALSLEHARQIVEEMLQN